MRYLRILGLHFEQVFQHRSRSFVWFLTAVINPLLMLLFWRGVGSTDSSITAEWSISDINTYYLFLIIAGSLLVSHVQEDIAEFDIREGRLAKYLLKPVSYYWFKFYEEIPYRVLQGLYGLLVLIGFFYFFGVVTLHYQDPTVTGLSLITLILAYFLSFTFKMIVGLFSFWLTDIWGIYELIEIIMVIMAGFVMPLSLYPDWLKSIAFTLPFSHMIYYPVMAVQGSFSVNELGMILARQLGWLVILVGIYQVLWRQGLKQFTAVGH